MKITKSAVIMITAVLVFAAANARGAQLLVSASVKATSFDASAGKIVKMTTSNATIINDCGMAADRQFVALLYDTTSMQLLALDVVDPCGNILCQVATFSSGGGCVDTGIVSGKKEVVCHASFSLDGGGGGDLLCDLKLSFDGMGSISGGKLKCTGVFEDGSGHPGTISITAGATLKFPNTCP